jgi:hypothetical protein
MHTLQLFTVWSQTWPGAHVPQLRDPPQPSSQCPHVAPREAQVLGVQALHVLVA